MKKIIILLILLCSISFANESKPQFELEAPNIVGIHPVYFIRYLISPFTIKMEYQRELEKINLLSRIKLHNYESDYPDDNTFSRSIELELGVRKLYYLAYHRKVRFGMYLQASMVNLFASKSDRNDYEGSIFGTGGIRFQFQHFIMDAEFGGGPQYQSNQRIFQREYRPAFMLGVAF